MVGSVHQRVAFYFSGYDIAGVDRYYAQIMRQTTYYARRFGVRFKVGALVRDGETGRAFPHCEVEADWHGTSVRTTLYFWDWQDVIKQEYAAPSSHRLVALISAYLTQLACGHWRRIGRAAPLFLSVISLPIWLLIIRGVLVAGAAASIYPALTGSVAGIAGVILCCALIWASLLFGRAHYEKFFACYIVFLDKVLRGRENMFASRLTRAADLTRQIVKTSDADEAIFIGHSFGALAAATCCSHAIDDAGEAGPALSLLTIGSLLPCVALDPSENTARPALSKILATADATWIDVYAPQDAFNFPETQPGRDFALKDAVPFKARFQVRPAIFDQIVAPRKIRKFRWNLLRMHFQFLMANDRAGGFDYFRYVTGPDPLRAQMDQ